MTQILQPLKTETVLIDISEDNQTSDAQVMSNGLTLVAIETPSNFVTSDISFLGARRASGTYLPIYNPATDTLYGITGAEASRHYPLDATMFMGVTYVKVKATTAQTTDDKIITLAIRAFA